MTVKEDKLIGACIGDVVGSYYEFENTDVYDFSISVPFIHGKLTDDSIMTFATMDAISNKKEFADTYADWHEWYPNRGYGGRFSAWAKEWKSGSKKIGDSWGNGAGMRVSPIAWGSNENDSILMTRLSVESSHSDPRAIESTIFLVEAHRAAIKEGKDGFKMFVQKNAGEKYDITTSIKDRIEKYNRWFDVSNHGCVPVAIRCVIESHDFESAIRLAVWHGGDTDTIAAMTGGVAAALYDVPKSLSRLVFDRMDDRMKSTLSKFKEIV